MTPSGRACIADFGLSSLISSISSIQFTNPSKAAKGGTLRYQAPELHEEQDNDQRSDIYGFASLAYEVRPLNAQIPAPRSFTFVTGSDKNSAVFGIAHGRGSYYDCLTGSSAFAPTFVFRNASIGRSLESTPSLLGRDPRKSANGSTTRRAPHGRRDSGYSSTIGLGLG